MGIGFIPIPILVDSHSHVLFNSCPIPMGLPWDSHSHWDSQSHAHLYCERPWLRTTPRFRGTTTMTCEIFTNPMTKFCNSMYPSPPNCCGFMFMLQRKMCGAFWTPIQKFLATPVITQIRLLSGPFSLKVCLLCPLW